MSVEGPQIKIGNYPAATDLSDSTDQYCFVQFSSATAAGPHVNLVATSGLLAHGIIQNTPSSGQAAEVCVFGESKLRFSSTHAAIAAGDVLYARNTGVGNNVTSSSFFPLGIAIDTLAADTSGIITVFFNPTMITSLTS